MGRAMKKTIRNIKRLFFLLATFAGTSCALQATSSPSVVRFEQVANDASNLQLAIVGNSWGGNQPRIVQSADGQISLLYLRQDATGNPQWRLMQRNDSSSAWAEIATGHTSDNAHLLRDPVHDTLLVVAWPNGLPGIWHGPAFNQQAIPGSWQQLKITERHYDGVGIGSDGTLCLKASHEYFPPGVPQTLITDTDYICGKNNGSAYVWGNYNAVSTNYRHAYDYLYPSVKTPQGVGLLAISQRDLYKDAAGISKMAGFPYVFNGTKIWWSDPNANPVTINSVVNVAPLSCPSGVTAAPERRMHESYLDSKGRLFIGYLEIDTSVSPAKQQLFLAVADSATGNDFFTSNMGLPPYGSIRIYQGANGRLWLLWSNKGTRYTQMVLYPLVETGTGNTASFSLGTKYDLSGAFAPYAIDGNTFIAVPRGGSAPANVIDGIMGACTVSYTTGIDYSTANCYNADNSGNAKVFYFRIQLPN